MRGEFIKRIRWHFIVFKQYYLIFFGIFILAYFSIQIISLNNSSDLQNPFICGDGTFDGTCSLTKPYFCENSKLIKNPGLCGCSDSFKLEMGQCVLDYHSDEWPVNLEYSIEGRKNSLDFFVYSDVNQYFDNLPRTKYYSPDELPRRDDFKLGKINDPIQKEFLMPLVVEIENAFPHSKDLQAKMAISLVQNIPYEESEFVRLSGTNIRSRISTFPYQVIYKDSGSCEEKSELMAFILRELGFGVVLFYFPQESHEVVGVKCPFEESYLNTGYCFVEATTPSPISFSEGRYLSGGGYLTLKSKPEIIFISQGISLGKDLDDYDDAEDLADLIDKIDSTGRLNPLQKKKIDSLRKKYNLKY